LKSKKDKTAIELLKQAEADLYDSETNMYVRRILDYT